MFDQRQFDAVDRTDADARADDCIDAHADDHAYADDHADANDHVDADDHAEADDHVDAHSLSRHACNQEISGSPRIGSTNKLSTKAERKGA